MRTYINYSFKVHISWIFNLIQVLFIYLFIFRHPELRYSSFDHAVWYSVQYKRNVLFGDNAGALLTHETSKVLRNPDLWDPELTQTEDLHKTDVWFQKSIPKIISFLSLSVKVSTALVYCCPQHTLSYAKPALFLCLFFLPLFCMYVVFLMQRWTADRHAYI